MEWFLCRLQAKSVPPESNIWLRSIRFKSLDIDMDVYVYECVYMGMYVCYVYDYG